MKTQVLFLCHYLVIMRARISQKKITIKEPCTLEILAAKETILPAVGGASCHSIRVEYGQQEMCCSWPHRVLNDQLALTCLWSFT